MSGKRKSSPRKNSAKSTRRLVWSGELTKEQLDLLYWNTWAFHQAAMAVRKEKDDKRLPLGSYQEISATTAALMNLGLSLELILKYCRSPAISSPKLTFSLSSMRKCRKSSA